MKHFTLKPAQQMPVPFPSLAEQKQIGTFFERLDALIALYRRRRDNLANVKKSLLEKMFPRDGAKVPEIRFDGFVGEWETRKFDELVTFFSGLTYSPNDVCNSGTLVLRSSNVYDGEIVESDNVYVNSAVVNCENVRPGDIIVVVRNGSRALIGKHAVIKKAMPNTVIGAFMTGIRSNNSSFINALLNTPHFEEEIAQNMGATINQITGYMFSKMSFTVPTDNDEQRQIGKFFQELDALIVLFSRLLEKIQNVKKSFLSKAFVSS